jgi:hypothetical protein
MRTFKLVNSDNLMPKAAAPKSPSDAEQLDAAADQAIAACGGDAREAVKALRLRMNF